MRPNEVITQSDVQLVQDDLCKFMMREVLNPKGLFYDHATEYATHPKFESVDTKIWFEMKGRRGQNLSRES